MPTSLEFAISRVAAGGLHSSQSDSSVVSLNKVSPQGPGSVVQFSFRSGEKATMSIYCFYLRSVFSSSRQLI